MDLASEHRGYLVGELRTELCKGGDIDDMC